MPKGTPNIYWKAEIDDFIEDFNKSKDEAFRNKLFEDKLHYPFTKLVECVHNKFKFPYIAEDHETRQTDAVGVLVSHIKKYHKSKGRSFSYFSVIAKNHFIALNDKNYKINCLTIRLDDGEEEKQKESALQLISIEDYEKNKGPDINGQLIEYLIAYFEKNFDNIFIKPRHKIIAKAFLELMRAQSDYTDIMFKRTLITKLHNMTGLSTPKMRATLEVIRAYYKQIRIAFLNDTEVIPPDCTTLNYWHRWGIKEKMKKMKSKQKARTYTDRASR